jgi:broad specificity phosphatase PhoE
MTTIYLVRHGEAVSNVNKNKHYSFYNQWGELGSSLTEKGKQQVKERSESLRDVHFDAVFSSDFTRARETAEIMALERNLAVQTSSLIREREPHLYAEVLDKKGKSIEQFREEMKADLSKLDSTGKMAYKYDEDMESAEEGASRIITFLREIAVAYPGKTVLVANHGNLIRSLLVHLGYAEFDELPSGAIANTGYVVLESDGVDFFVKQIEGIYKQQGAERNW